MLGNLASFEQKSFFLEADGSYFGNLGEATLFNKSRLALNVLITHTLR